MCFWHFLRVDVGVGSHGVAVRAPVPFSEFLQPVEPLVRLPQPVLAVDDRNLRRQPGFGFESTGSPSEQNPEQKDGQLKL